MKFTNNNRHLKSTFLFAFVFSSIAAFCLTGLVKAGEPVQAASRLNRRQLFGNYRILKYFLSANPEGSLTAIDAVDRDNPLLADIESMNQARRLLDGKNFEACDRMLAKISAQFPHIAAQRDDLQLRSLLGAKKTKSFILYYDRHPAASLPLRMLLLDSLLREGQGERARKEFKGLFINMDISAFAKAVSRPDLLNLLKGLDESSWFEKFSSLLESNSKAEFKREGPYCRYLPLVRLFKAEFAYLDRAYARAQTILQGGLGEKYQPFAEKILLKIAVRLDPQAEITERLRAIKENSPQFPEFLLDLAQILTGKGEFAKALPLYAQYLEQGSGQGEAYWKTVWLLAWIHYRLEEKDLALKYFRIGGESPLLTYRIASQYWLGKLETGKTPQMQGYPFSYYAVKVLQDKSSFKNLQQPFIRTIDKPPSGRFQEIVADLKTLAKYGLWQDCSETIHAVQDDVRLQPSDRNLLKIIESILYIRQNQFYQAFARFRSNFKAIESVRLPNFLSGIFFPRQYTELIATYSREQLVDPYLVQALIREESFFNANSLSPAKAYGLMQLLHGTAREIARGSNLKIKARDLYDPETNIRLGLNYLKTLLDKYDGRLYLALAAYNAGAHRVDQWRRDFPGADEEEFIEMIPFSETRKYVKNILRNYFFYRYYYENEKA